MLKIYIIAFLTFLTALQLNAQQLLGTDTKTVQGNVNIPSVIEPKDDIIWVSHNSGETANEVDGNYLLLSFSFTSKNQINRGDVQLYLNDSIFSFFICSEFGNLFLTFCVFLSNRSSTNLMSWLTCSKDPPQVSTHVISISLSGQKYSQK